MIEGFGSGYVPLANWSGCGTWRPKNIRIRISNTAFFHGKLFVPYGTVKMLLWSQDRQYFTNRIFERDFLSVLLILGNVVSFLLIILEWRMLPDMFYIQYISKIWRPFFFITGWSECWFRSLSHWLYAPFRQKFSFCATDCGAFRTSSAPSSGETVHSSSAPPSGEIVHSSSAPSSGETVHSSAPSSGETLHSSSAPSSGETEHSSSAPSSGETVHSSSAPSSGETVHSSVPPGSAVFWWREPGGAACDGSLPRRVLLRQAQDPTHTRRIQVGQENFT